MFKRPRKVLTAGRRVCKTTSAARSHANTTTGPRPIANRSSTTVAKHGPSRPRVASPEQMCELPGTGPSRPTPEGRSNLRDRDARMTPFSSPDSSYFVGIDVAKASSTWHARTPANPHREQRPRRHPPDRRFTALQAAHPDRDRVHRRTGTTRAPRPSGRRFAGRAGQSRNVRHFAIGLGILAKTDPIDAAVLMEFARRANLRLAEKRSQIRSNWMPWSPAGVSSPSSGPSRSTAARPPPARRRSTPSTGF